MHQLCIQVLALDLFLPFSGQKLDWIRIREAGMTLFGRDLPQVALLAMDLVVDQDSRESVL
jgi:hypothetical protein